MVQFLVMKSVQGFYSLSKTERYNLIGQIESLIEKDLQNRSSENIQSYASDNDTYIRKNTYLIIGKLYNSKPHLRPEIVNVLNVLLDHSNEKVRQTVVNAFGEIGKSEGDIALRAFEQALFDFHHIVRNALIGSLKKMGEVNPQPVLSFSKKFLHNPNYHIRRQVIHGVELRGRTHPEEVLPLLKEAQFETNRVVKDMIVHVLGQISYKKGCLEKVIAELRTWENKELVQQALKEILETHEQYRNFSALSYNQAKEYIETHV